MKDNNYAMFMVTRMMVSLLPLLLGLPMLSFCFCVQNMVMNTVIKGEIYGGVSILVTSAIGGLVCAFCGYGAAYGGFFALQLALAAALCTFAAVTRRSFPTGLLLTSFGYGLGNILQLGYAANDAGLSVVDYMFSGVQEELDRMTASYETQLAASGVSVDVSKFMDMLSNGLRSCVPAYIVINCILAGYLAMWMVSCALRRTPLNNGHSFAYIRLSVPSVCFGAVMLALIFVPSDMVRLVGVNGFIVFGALAFAAGMSLMEFLLRRKVRGLFARAVIHALIIFGGMALSAFLPFANIFILYAILGIVDCFASIRKKVTAAS